jgi:hypothetical protein
MRPSASDSSDTIRRQRHRQMPAQKTGGGYKTKTPATQTSFVVAIPSRVFRDGMGIFSSELSRYSP